jgi:hypothetical protein
MAHKWTKPHERCGPFHVSTRHVHEVRSCDHFSKFRAIDIDTPPTEWPRHANLSFPSRAIFENFQRHGNWDSLDTNSTIMDYISNDWFKKGHFMLLRWKPHTGQLDEDATNLTWTNSHFGHWINNHTLRQIQYTRPSPYGSVALLLNTDHISRVDWSVPPPVPLWTYTLPNEARNHPHAKDAFHLVPTPYDTNNFNRHCSRIASKEKLSFHDSPNQVLWRGKVHSQEEKSRIRLLEMAKLPENQSWLNATTTRENNMLIEQMAHYRYQLDVGGLSGTAWGSIRWKLCSGMVVFKVDTWSQDWWHACRLGSVAALYSGPLRLV